MHQLIIRAMKEDRLMSHLDCSKMQLLIDLRGIHLKDKGHCLKLHLATMNKDTMSKVLLITIYILIAYNKIHCISTLPALF